jgi:hypothetical protein
LDSEGGETNHQYMAAFIITYTIDILLRRNIQYATFQ